MLIPFGILSGAAGGAGPLLALNAYFAGGSTIRNDGPGLTTVDKFIYSTSTRSTLATGLSADSYEMAGTSNTGIAGYFSLRGTAVNKFSLPSDTRSILTSIAATRFQHAGAENDGVAGYLLGGYDSGFNRLSSIIKIVYSTDSNSTIATTLSSARNGLSAMSDDGVAVYAGGGQTGGGEQSTVDKITVAADTRTTLATGLSTGVLSGTAFNNKGVAGYFTDDLSSTRVDKFSFPTDTRSVTTSLSARHNWNSATEQNGVKAYIALGVNADDSVVNLMNEFAFPTDTRTATLTLSSNRRAGAGASA